MGSEHPSISSETNGQLEFDFERILESAEVLSREDFSSAGQGEGGPYDPVAQTSDYMHQVVAAEAKWETTVQEARTALMSADPRELYLAFLLDLKQQIESGSPQSGVLSRLLEAVAHRGLGIRRQALHIAQPRAGRTRYRIVLDEDEVFDHLQEHVIGTHFLNELVPNESVWQGRTPVIGASDVSQHRSAIPVPARYFKRSVPFVLNNAAGAVYSTTNGVRSYENIFNPKPDEALLRWMLIDPSYQDELEPEDYQRCISSAMDVGQYKFDLDYLMKSALRSPDVILRDGSIFPQDAYLDNFVIQTKRGDFTREAIKDLLNCLLYAEAVGSLYCGVTKRVQLKVYSALFDWFVAREIDPSWRFGNYTLNDGQAMSLLLASPTFVGDNLNQVIATCLIRRSFTTRAGLNTRTNLADIESYFARNQELHPEVDIRPYRRVCDLANLYMFFIGHSKSPQQQLPRYEFFSSEELGEPWEVGQMILAALRHCSLMADTDHSYMADEPITYLMPSVTQHAHSLSKDVGKAIDSATGQWIMARYKRFLGS